MNRDSFESLAREFSHAKHAYQQLEVAQDAENASLHWGHFLTHLQQFYFKLRAAVDKTNPAEVAWRDATLKRQDDEPVFLYAREARNTDQHTVTAITVPHRGENIGLPGGRGVHVDMIGIRGDDGVVDVHGHLPNGIPVQQVDLVTINQLRLQSVKQRDKIIDVPTTFLGIPIDGGNLMQVAFILRGSLGDLLREAEGWVR